MFVYNVLIEVLIDGRNFYDQPITDLVKQYNKIRKTAIGQGDDYNREFVRLPLLQRSYNLIAIDLSRQKELDADSRAIQQLNKSKEAVLLFPKGTEKVF